MGFFDRLFGGGAPRGNPLDSRGPGGLGVGELARRLGIPEQQLRDCRVSYHEFAIPKRAGGVRRIFAPDPPLKAVQTLILRRLLRRLQSHEAAHAFERGRSILTNALPHVARPVVVRLDLKDFFPSITSKRVEAYFGAIGWGPEATQLLGQLCTYQGALPAGAPTSPRLSNLVNRRLDVRLSALAAALQCNYTRYADDITFSIDTSAADSSAHAINSLIFATKQVLSEEGYSLHMNKKLRIQRSHDRQIVTGVVVNEQTNLPRQTRRWLRAVEHHVAKSRPATLTAMQLQGWRALASMLRPLE